nr:meiotically up-regulated gene 184 protein [Quercus suber]
MVKSDVKHSTSSLAAVLGTNVADFSTLDYYADLELPTTCSIDEVKKQYRKLALQYHPDRNAGKEEEYVPKFQAIQTAHEILGDATQKRQYDADRRKAGLYPQGATSRGNQPTGNPYTASSAFPPPQRRTQPGTYQRAQPAGADRFAQFPRGAPTARKDGTGTQERANMFRAWQNMNSQAQQEHQRPNPTPPPQTPNRRRPAPPPRPQSKMPTEEEIRAGMNYRRPPPPPPPQSADSDRAEARQSAWQAFHESGPATPGLNRSKTTRSARKQGFDPNMPGSDERPASHGYYSTRHKSADFGIPQTTSQSAQDEASFPPPPPGPPPRSPLSPTSPSNQRSMADPLKPFKARVMDDEVPYAEANRVSTPYTQASGEKTALSSEGLRRSASVRDTSRMNEQRAADSRARSNSPLRRQANNSANENNQTRKPFVQYNSSEESVDGDDPDSVPSPTSRPFAAPGDRPRKTATPRTQRRNGAAGTNTSTTTDDTNGEGMPGMQQKSGNNMYATPSSFSSPQLKHTPFNATQWATNMFGSSLKRKAGQLSTSFPSWAIPSSILPRQEKTTSTQDPAPHKSPISMALLLSHQPRNQVSEGQTAAYTSFRVDLQRLYGSIPNNLDMDVFLKLASTAACGRFTGEKPLDAALQRALATYSSFLSRFTNLAADAHSPLSFDIPINDSTFMPNPNRNRSEESINTNFSPDGFSGKFEAMPDYFPPQLPRRTSASPLLRTASRTAGIRASTSNGPSSKGQTMPPPPPPLRPLELDGEEEAGSVDGPVKFKPEQWKKTFAEPSWAWQPPAPSGASSPNKTGSGSRSSSWKVNKTSSKPASAGTQEAPYVPKDDGSYVVPKGEPVTADYGDAMDIDTPPPATSAQHPSSSTAVPPDEGKHPRQYHVAPSLWHQQQQKEAAQQRQASDQSAKLSANLEDLAHVEPLAQSTGSGLQGLDDLGSTLPFKSQAAASLPEHAASQPQLRLPPMPKAPEPPTKLTKQNWQIYSQAFGAYLRAYRAFNETMLRHFATREGKLQTLLSGGLAWLEATGDTTDEVGFGSYMRGVREDEHVREVWNLGYERHTDAVGGFAKVRERVRKLAIAGTLLE